MPKTILEDYEAEEIREAYRAGTPQKTLARTYGVSQAQISNIITARNWKTRHHVVLVDGEAKVIKTTAQPIPRHRPYDDDELAERYLRGESVRELAESLGIHESTVYRALNRLKVERVD